MDAREDCGYCRPGKTCVIHSGKPPKPDLEPKKRGRPSKASYDASLTQSRPKT